MEGAPLCSYLVLVGVSQRLNFLLVLVVLGVEGVDYLQTGRELDVRMKAR